MSVDLQHPWNIVFLAGFVVYIGIRNVFANRVKAEKTAVRRIDGLEKGLLAVVTLGSLLLPVLYLFTPLLRFADYQLPVFAPWIGTVVMLFALWLFRRSHADLGRQWSISLPLPYYTVPSASNKHPDASQPFPLCAAP